MGLTDKIRLNGIAQGFNSESVSPVGVAVAKLLSLDDTDRTGDPSGESHWLLLNSSAGETEESGPRTTGVEVKLSDLCAKIPVERILLQNNASRWRY